MSCTSPIYALDLGVKENGKRNIKILAKRADISSMAQIESRYGHGHVIPLPCGKCLACRKSKAREWAIRCVLEASEYEDNCFITLTYDDAFYAPSMKHLREDLTNFFKRLRFGGYKFRYFACCEAGHQNKRYHFHVLMFGVDLDKKTLEKYWPFGFVQSLPLFGGSCFYVAQYAEKKIFGEDDYSFITMSNRPGIGYSWLEKHLDVVKYGQVYGSFGSSAIPRYFERISGIDVSEIKEDKLNKAEAKRIHEMVVHGIDRVEKLYDYQAQIDFNNFEHKERRKDL